MFLKVGSTQILNSSGNGSIYSILLGSILSFIIIHFIIKIFNYEKDLNLFEKINKLYGKLGFLINFCLFINIIN